MICLLPLLVLSASPGPHLWTLVLDTGETLALRTDWPKTGNAKLRAEGEWTRAGRSLDKSTFTFDGNAPDLIVDRVPTAAEQQNRMDATKAVLGSPQMKALDARRDAENL